MKVGDTQSMKSKWRNTDLNPGPFAPQAKSLTTRPPSLAFSHKTNDNIVSRN